MIACSWNSCILPGPNLTGILEDVALLDGMTIKGGTGSSQYYTASIDDPPPLLQSHIASVACAFALT